MKITARAPLPRDLSAVGSGLMQIMIFIGSGEVLFNPKKAIEPPRTRRNTKIFNELAGEMRLSLEVWPGAFYRVDYLVLFMSFVVQWLFLD